MVDHNTVITSKALLTYEEYTKLHCSGCGYQLWCRVQAQEYVTWTVHCILSCGCVVFAPHWTIIQTTITMMLLISPMAFWYWTRCYSGQSHEPADKCTSSSCFKGWDLYGIGMMHIMEGDSHGQLGRLSSLNLPYQLMVGMLHVDSSQDASCPNPPLCWDCDGWRSFTF